MSAPDERPDPRDVMARLRARTKLISSLADEPGLSTAQIADVVAGVRSVTAVLAERDAAQPDTATPDPKEETP